MVPRLPQILEDTDLLFVFCVDVSTGLRDAGGSYLALQGSSDEFASSHSGGGRVEGGRDRGWERGF